MPNFDVDKYLANRVSSAAQQKFLEIDQATSAKVAGIQAKRAEFEAQKAAEQQAYQDSWVGKLGLEPTGFVANRVNDVASVASGASRLAGQTLALPLSAMGMADTAGLDEQHIQAYNRYKTGALQPGDMALLNTPTATGGTPIQKIMDSESARTAARGVADTFDLSNTVDPTNRNKLVADLGQNFDSAWGKVTQGWDEGKKGNFLNATAGVASGIGSLLANAGSAIMSNPSAVREYVLENAPQLAVGALGKAGQGAMALSNVGYAVDTYQQGIENYAKANGGQLPPEEQRQKMAYMAVTLALAEEAGDVGQLGAAKLLGKAAKTTEELAKDAGKGGIRGIGKAVAGGVLSEAPTEGYQTYAESEITGKPATAKDIYTAAVIGGASGGGLSGGMRTVAEVTGATPEKAAKRMLNAEKAKILDDAAATGNVDALLDPATTAYAPHKAIDALQKHSNAEGVTGEQQQTNFEKANQIVSRLQGQLDLSTEAGVQKKIEAAKAELAAADPADKPEVESYIKDLEAALVDVQSNDYSKRVEELTGHLERAQASLNDFNQERDLKNTDVEAEMANINGSDAVAAKSSADRLINLSMAIPDRLTHQTATALADDTKNGLSESQRTYLRAFSEARQAENRLMDTGKVAKEVFFGNPDKGMVGIKDYRANIAADLGAGNQSGAKKQLSMLSSFATDHQQKADLASQAFATGKPHRLISDGKGGWSIEPGQWESEEARVKNGGLNITARSEDLIAGIRSEADALNSARTELRAAYNLKFTTPTEKTNGTQATEAQQAEAQGQEASSAAGTRSEVASSTDGQKQAFRLKVINALTTDGEQSVPSDVQAVADQVPQELVDAVAEYRGAQEAFVQAEEVLSGEELEQAREFTKNTLERLSPKLSELYSTIDRLYDEQVVAEKNQLQSTQETSTQEQTTEESSADTSAEDGTSGLSVLKNRNEQAPNTKLGQVYKTMNKVVAFFTQSKVKVEKDSDIAKDRPLVSIDNFLNRWSAKELVPSDFFPDGLLDNEAGALGNFQIFHNKWAPLVRENMKKGGIPNLKGTMPNPEFAYEDPLQDFFTEDGKLDENVVSAVVYAAYSWLVDSMNAPALKEDEDILKMHGLQGRDDVSVSREGRRALRLYSAFKDSAANSIGRYAVDALGLQTKPQATVDYLNKVKTAFGLQAMVLLAQDEVNLIDVDTIAGDKLNAFLPGIDIEPSMNADGTVRKTARGTVIYPTLTYIKVRRDAKLQLPNTSKSIRDANVGAFGVVQRLFSTEHNSAYATWKPIKFRQKKAKGTDQKIPSKLNKVLNAAQQVPHTIIPEMWNALTVLGDEVILAAAGHREFDEAKIQKENRESVEAKNNGLEDQLDGMKTLVQTAIDASPKGIGQAFYPVYEVWRNFRVGVATRDMNLQTSKIHRFMFTRPEWKTKLHLADTAAIEQFEVSVAQAFGVKVDQQSNEDTLVDFEARMNADGGKIKKLAMALASAIDAPTTEVLSSGQKQEVGKFAADREGMQSLQALVAYGKFLNAKQRQEAGEDVRDVTVHMMVGVDGKTNGPMLTMLALGASESVDSLFGFLNRGGFYRAKDGVKNFNHWYKQLGSRDLYQDLAFKILDGIQASADMAAIHTFTGSLTNGDKVTSAGRNLAKTPLTSFVFGSSIEKSISNMKEAFVQQVFDRIEAVANGDDRNTTSAEIVRSLNRMMGTKMREDMGIEALMARSFSEKEKESLREAFNEQIGSRVEQTMREYFAAYIERRNSVNKAIQVSFGIYSAIYNDLREKEIQRLAEAGELAMDNAGKNRLHDLTAEQEAALRERVKSILPLANTAYTVDDGNLDAGLYMAKTRNSSSDAEHNRVKVLLGRLIPTGDNWRTNQMTGQAMETIESSPGVAGLPYFMHSLDSFLMHDSIEGTETLNVHDEAGNGVGNVVRTAQAINHSTWKGMLKFSPATEAYEMLGRAIQNAAKMVEAGTLSPEALKGVEASLRALLPKKMAARTDAGKLALLVLDLANADQFKANNLRLQGLAEMTHVDQYTWEGGQYNVTEKDRDEVKAELLALKQNRAVSAELEAAAKVLQEAMGKAQTKAAVEPMKVDSDSERQAGARSIGGYGSSQYPNDFALNQLLVDASANGTKQLTAKEMLKVVYDYTRNSQMDPARAEFSQKLIKALAKTIGDDVRVNFVTPNTDLRTLPSLLATAHGWFNPKSKQVQILGWGMTNSNVGLELVLHEMLHAATYDALRDGSSKQAKELEALRVQAAEFVETMSAEDKAGFGFAVSTVDEMISWGLTNQNFQQKVLTQLTVAPVSAVAKPMNGLQKFIQTLTNLFFKPTGLAEQQQLVNGMTALISGTMSLLAERNGTQEDSALAVMVFEKARAAADAVDAFGQTDMNGRAADPKIQKLIDAHNKAYKALVAETGQLIEQAKRLNTQYAEDLQFRLDELNSGDLLEDVLDDTLIALYRDTQSYLVEFNNRQGSLDLTMAMTQTIDRFNTMEIFEALDTKAVEPVFRDHLANLLDGVVQKLHGPFGAFAAAMRKTEAKTPLDTWLKAMETGATPFASSIVASGFAASDQEMFAMEQVEATVKAALDGNEATTKTVYKELYKLYTEVYNKVKPADFIAAGMTQADYDFVFKLESNGQRSDYLARFAALGLASQNFNKLMKMATEVDSTQLGEGSNWAERLSSIFQKILTFFSEKISHTWGGQQADEKLLVLVDQLVDIEAKKRYGIKVGATNEMMGKAEELTAQATGKARELLTDLSNTDLIKNSKSGLVRFGGTLVRMSTKGILDKYMGEIQNFRDSMVKEKHGLVMHMLSELKGPLQKFDELLRARKKQEQARKTIITQTAKLASKMFVNEGKDLTAGQKAAITRVFLRTGMHKLMGNFTLSDIDNLLSDSTALNAAIGELEGQLPSQWRDKYVEQVNALGFYNVEQLVKTPILMLNAHLISRMAGTQYAAQISKEDAKAAEPVIAQLVTLYGMRYLKEVDKRNALEVLRSENSREDNTNGVEFVLALHRQQEDESLKKLFGENPALMAHGYTSEILNPHTTFEVVTLEEGKNLLEQGYKYDSKVQDDPIDVDNEEKFIYVQRNGGQAPWLSQIMSLTGMHTKGTLKHSGYMNPKNYEGVLNASMQTTFDNKKMAALDQPRDPRRDLSEMPGNNLAPVYNSKGEIVNWRYLMAGKTRDRLLERNNNFDTILGTIAGSIFDKKTAGNVNSEVAEALREQYESDYWKNSEAYVEVSAKSTDPELREIWALLPEETRDEIQMIWGRRGMKVRKDTLNIVFGYRKATLSETFMKEPAARNAFEKFTLEMLESYLVFSGRTPEQAANHLKKIGYMVNRGERIWQAIVQEIKDIVVVKNLSTLLGNVQSNWSQLILHGVSLKDIVHHHTVAIRGALAYQRDEDRLAELNKLVATGYTQGNDNEIQREIVRLKDLLDRNPVKELMEAGMLPTIVEDVAVDDDIYSFKNELAKKTEKYTAMLPEGVRNAGRFMYMTHDTKLYQMLSQATQLSDFVARYTLYQHLISKKQEPMSKKDALFKISEEFINYDQAMPKQLQFLDDMGIVPFTKYFLRIQRVLVKNFRENPARVLMTGLIDRYHDLGPIVLDSHWAHHITNNPIYGGAFRYPMTLDELLTVKAPFALLK